MNLKEYQQLKARVETLRTEADRAAGALDQLMKRLMSEFNCKTVEQARKLLDRLEREEKEAEEAFNKALKAFKRKHKDVLE